MEPQEVWVTCSCGGIWEPERRRNADGSWTYSVTTNHLPPGHQMSWRYTRRASGPSSTEG